MKRVDRQLALKAARLNARNITGEELAKRLKVGLIPAHDLAQLGLFIQRGEALRLTEREWDAMKVIARVVARHAFLGLDRVKLSDVDHAAGKRTGWCGRIIEKRLMHWHGGDPMKQIGLVQGNHHRRIWLTAAGWAFVWEAGLIKPDWRVPA